MRQGLVSHERTEAVKDPLSRHRHKKRLLGMEGFNGVVVSTLPHRVGEDYVARCQCAYVGFRPEAEAGLLNRAGTNCRSKVNLNGAIAYTSSA